MDNKTNWFADLQHFTIVVVSLKLEAKLWRPLNERLRMCDVPWLYAFDKRTLPLRKRRNTVAPLKKATGYYCCSWCCWWMNQCACRMYASRGGVSTYWYVFVWASMRANGKSCGIACRYVLCNVQKMLEPHCRYLHGIAYSLFRSIAWLEAVCWNNIWLLLLRVKIKKKNYGTNWRQQKEKKSMLILNFIRQMPNQRTHRMQAMTLKCASHCFSAVNDANNCKLFASLPFAIGIDRKNEQHQPKRRFFGRTYFLSFLLLACYQSHSCHVTKHIRSDWIA